jgi:hypothetical protein
MKKTHLVIATSSAVLLSACGGGGGGDNNTPVTPSAVVSTASFPVAGTVSASEQTSDSYTVSTIDSSGKTDTLTVTNVPGAQATFEKMTASTSVQTAILKQNGVLLNQVVSTSYFQLTPYLNYGEIDQSTGHYTVTDITTPLYLPATAKVGDTGAINAATTYTNSTKTTVVSRMTRTWSLEADTATTAFLCANIVTTPVSGTVSKESHCYRITTSGVITGHKMIFTESGQTLTFQ